jgi:membrane-associated phospholipid phosphatase
MEPLTQFSLEATRWLQSTYPQFELVANILNLVGRFEFYLVVSTLILWCLNKRVGATLIYLLSLSSLLNLLLKHLLRSPRPLWIDSSLGLSEEVDYGLPSWHAQMATVFYLYLAIWIKRGWFWVLAIIMIFLMALSRIFLGVHTIADVAVGILIGVLLVLAYFLWQRYLAVDFNKRILGQRLLAVVSIPIIIGLVYIVALLIIGQPDRQVAWESFIDAAEVSSLENVARSFGALLGLGVGFILEASRVRFQVEGQIWKRGLRYILGLVVAVGLWLGLGLIIPSEPLLVVIPLVMLQQILLGLWISFYAPMVFVRLRLADASPKPEITLTM